MTASHSCPGCGAETGTRSGLCRWCHAAAPPDVRCVICDRYTSSTTGVCLGCQREQQHERQLYDQDRERFLGGGGL